VLPGSLSALASKVRLRSVGGPFEGVPAVSGWSIRGCACGQWVVHLRVCLRSVGGPFEGAPAVSGWP